MENELIINLVNKTLSIVYNIVYYNFEKSKYNTNLVIYIFLKY